MSGKNLTEDQHDIFVVVENKDNLLRHFDRIFGNHSFSGSQIITASFGHSLGSYRWNDHELTVTLMGKDDGPIVVHPRTSRQDTLRNLREFRDSIEVNPTKVFRRTLRAQVNDSALSGFDKRIRFWAAFLGLPPALWAVTGVFPGPRLAIVFVLAVFLVIFAYADKEDAVDVRLFLVNTAWLSVVSIAVVVPIILVLSLPIVLQILGVSTEIWVIVAFAISQTVALYVMLADLHFGRKLEKKASSYWQELTLEKSKSSRSPRGLANDALSLCNISMNIFVPLSVFVFFDFILESGVAGAAELDYLVTALILLNAVLLLFMIMTVYRQLTGSRSRVRMRSASTVVGEEEFSAVVAEVAKRESARKELDVRVFGR